MMEVTGLILLQVEHGIVRGCESFLLRSANQETECPQSMKRRYAVCIFSTSFRVGVEIHLAV